MRIQSSFSKKILSLLIVASSLQALAQETEKSVDIREANPKKVSLKKVFKNLPVETRNEMLSRAQVIADDFDSDQISQLDVVGDLQRRCGPDFSYKKNYDDPSHNWPVVECNYIQDDGSLSGANEKFLCEFKDSTAKDGKRTRKVKYLYNKPFDSKPETISTILASLSTRMLGFYAETYCPAIVRCHNCPSGNPWHKNKRSSDAPGSSVYDFPIAIVEMPIPALTMTNHPQKGPGANPQGVNWEEAQLFKGPIQDQRKLRIEREAWMLWVNLLMDFDAYNWNQRTSCLDPAIDPTTKTPVCNRPIVYTHDAGYSFYKKFNFSAWNSSQPLIAGDNGTCRGGMTQEIFQKERKNKHQSLLLGATISDEARNMLVERLSAVTEKQWTEIYQVSKAEEVERISLNSWLRAWKKKIDQLKTVKCQEFDAGTSVFGMKN